MDKYYRTKRDAPFNINRLTTIQVPAGAECITVQNPMGVSYALKNPHQYIAKEDTFTRHDATHHYIWVNADNVEELTLADAEALEPQESDPEGENASWSGSIRRTR